MRKMTPRGQFMATIMLIIFAGVMITITAFGTKAKYDYTHHNQKSQKTQITQEIKDVSSINITPTPEITLAKVVKPAPSKHELKEIIVCQVIDGVKHFSNEFIQEVA